MATNSGQRAFCRPAFSVMLNIALCVFGAQAAYAADLGTMTPAELAGDARAWTVLDARPRVEWEKGHLPGALSFSWEDYTRTDEKGVRYRMWPPAELSSILGRMGISEQAAIVVYGDADSSWGGEGWVCWILAYLGHKGPVRLLDGGISAWQKGKFPISKGAENPPVKATDYGANIYSGVRAVTEEIEKDPSSMVLVDVRSNLEWLKGRIPGSVHISWKRFFEGPDRRPLSASALRGLLEGYGISPEKPVVYYCTGGVRSAYAWMVHELAGFAGARNYEGGIEAWNGRPGSKDGWFTRKQ